MKVLFIDHYDSFSFNLIDWLRKGSQCVEIIRVPYDDPNLATQFAKLDMPIIFSPGPKSPEDVQPSMTLLGDKLGLVPILGVCLGHQILGLTLGSRVVRAMRPFHGSQRRITIDQTSIVFGECEVLGASYNSLVLDKSLLPAEVITGTNDYSEVEMIEVNVGRWPAVGVQFHPESFMSEGMEALLEFWTQSVQNYYSSEL